MAEKGVKRWRGLLDAAKHNDGEAVKYWVEEEGVSITQTNVKGQTAAHLAASNDNYPVLKYLLQRDRNKVLIRAADRKGLTVFLLAARDGALDVVRALLNEHSEHVNAFERARKQPRNSAVHLAAQNGKLNVLKYLVEEKRADINVLNDFQASPLFLAIQNQCSDVIRYMVERGNANLTLTDSMGANILHAVLSYKNDTTIVEYLLDDRKIDVDVNAKNKFGETVLMKAATFNYLNFVRYLLSARKVDVNLSDFMNKTPLYMAALLGHVDMVKYLVEHGADTEIKDYMGQTPLEATQCQPVIDYLKEIKRKRSRGSGHSAASR